MKQQPHMMCKGAISSLMSTPSPHPEEMVVKEVIKSSRKSWLPRNRASR